MTGGGSGGRRLPGASTPLLGGAGLLTGFAAVIAVIVGVLSPDPATAHPLGAGPPPTAELSADGHEVRVAWRAEDDDVADLLESLGLAEAGTSERYRWWAGEEPMSADERAEASADPALAAYFDERLTVEQEGTPCDRRVEMPDDVLHEEVVAMFTCPSPVEVVDVGVGVLHDVDDDYRTLGFVGDIGAGEYAAFTAGASRHSLDLTLGAGAPQGALVVLAEWSGGGLPETVEQRLGALTEVEPTAPAVLLGVLAAALLGAGHGFVPGHAKAATAAYLTGGGGRRRDALLVGGLVAIAHTGSVLVIGAVLHVAPFEAGRGAALGAASTLAVGVVIAMVGVTMLRRHRRGHHHPHPWEDAVPSRRGLATVGLAGGLLPSPSAVLLLATAWVAGRPELGLLLVAAFGLGLAGTVAAVALAALAGRDALFARREDSRLAGRLARAAPLTASLVVASSGALLTVAGLTALL